MEVIEALKKRQMCRHFEQVPVKREYLEKLVYAASRAPSGGNMLVRELIVVDDPLYVRMLRGVTPSFLANSPVAIVVCTNLTKAEDVMGLQGRDILSLLDSGAAAENIALEATELGLGVSFVRSATESGVKEVLDIPKNYRVDIIVGIGIKSENRPPPMKSPKPIVHHNRFGVKWDGR